VPETPPAAGKIAQVSPALLDETWLVDSEIVVPEPRRIAAHAAAEFMAVQRGETVDGRSAAAFASDHAFPTRPASKWLPGEFRFGCRGMIRNCCAIVFETHERHVVTERLLQERSLGFDIDQQQRQRVLQHHTKVVA
jgi:hypothetical protein